MHWIIKHMNICFKGRNLLHCIACCRHSSLANWVHSRCPVKGGTPSPSVIDKVMSWATQIDVDVIPMLGI